MYERNGKKKKILIVNLNSKQTNQKKKKKKEWQEINKERKQREKIKNTSTLIDMHACTWTSARKTNKKTNTNQLPSRQKKKKINK